MINRQYVWDVSKGSKVVNNTDQTDCDEYLAKKYHFDLKMHTVDPRTGEVIPIDDKDKVYFDK